MWHLEEPHLQQLRGGGALSRVLRQAGVHHLLECLHVPAPQDVRLLLLVGRVKQVTGRVLTSNYCSRLDVIDTYPQLRSWRPSRAF
jgi:hypothetical protein